MAQQLRNTKRQQVSPLLIFTYKCLDHKFRGSSGNEGDRFHRGLILQSFGTRHKRLWLTHCAQYSAHSAFAVKPHSVDTSVWIHQQTLTVCKCVNVATTASTLSDVVNKQHRNFVVYILCNVQSRSGRIIYHETKLVATESGRVRACDDCTQVIASPIQLYSSRQLL